MSTSTQLRIRKERKKDTFKDAGPRLIYERLTGQSAPTFKIEDINQAQKRSSSEERFVFKESHNFDG